MTAARHLRLIHSTRISPVDPAAVNSEHITRVQEAKTFADFDRAWDLFGRALEADAIDSYEEDCFEIAAALREADLRMKFPARAKARDHAALCAAHDADSGLVGGHPIEAIRADF